MPYLNTSIHYHIHFEALVQLQYQQQTGAHSSGEDCFCSCWSEICHIALQLRGRPQEGSAVLQVYLNHSYCVNGLTFVLESK